MKVMGLSLCCAYLNTKGISRLRSKELRHMNYFNSFMYCITCAGTAQIKGGVMFSFGIRPDEVIQNRVCNHTVFPHS